MNKKAYKALEYYKIIDLLTDKASSPMGKDLCRKLTPSTDIEEIRSMQLQTHDALARLFKKGGISFGSVKDIRGTLKRLTVGSALNAPELLSVCSLLENTGRVKAYSRSDRDDGMTDSLDGMFAALEPLTPLSAETRRGTLSEDAFYLLRCARLYDLPFAIGCMVFVCRRFALLFDRTEQLARELDARVAERTKELTAETEARKSMMLNIFHDLRSPLFAVSGGLETLESAPEALPALLPALRQRIEFLRRLTEDLFLAAKLEQKQILLNEDRAALNEEAAAVCAACRSEADQKGVELHVSADTPLPVWGDSVRLQQIIQNLVTNAIHYTPAGGSIHVDCRAEDETACVSVQDTGCGIAPEDQSAVFDRYFHTTADKKHDSTGLGLTIAQELAHLHHGEITLQSEVGKGSIFTLRLPLLTD
mgnify:CR=1 FL=1